MADDKIRSLFDAFFSERHYLECPCGAKLTTENMTLAAQWTELHAPHAMPPPKTPTA
jgi:hypothetical protein